MTKLLHSTAFKLMLVLSAGWLAAGCDVTIGAVDNARYTERETKTFQVSGAPDIVLSTFDGAVEVRAADRSDVSVEVEKRGANKQSTDQIEVRTAQEGNRITVEVKDRDQRHIRFGFSTSRSANVVLLVPLQANIDARTGDGNVVIDRVKGRVTLESGDGNIRVTDHAGDLKAHTGDGTIALERVDGRVDLDTGDGSVSVNGRLEVLKVRTGDGTVKVRAAEGSRMADDWEVHTGDGSIGVELPADFGADLDAHASDGSVTLADLTVKGDVSRHTARGQLGAGGRPFRLSTGDGTIRISGL